jgi:hypothetical protein
LLPTTDASGMAINGNANLQTLMLDAIDLLLVAEQ